MSKTYLLLLAVTVMTAISFPAAASDQIKDANFAEVKIGFQHESVAPETNSSIQITFNLAKDWHFYADEKTAPQDMSLKIVARGQGLIFSEPVWPKSHSYFDKFTGKKLEVYSGNFSVFIPFTAEANSANTEVKVVITGLSCSEQLCKPISYELAKKLDISASAGMNAPAFSVPVEPRQSPRKGDCNIGGANHAAATATHIVLPLAILAGLLLNVMPCVWPILPIIVMRLVSGAEKSRAKSIMLGIAFAIGIILFFAVLAVVNIVLKLGFGMVFQWGDQFRNPAFVAAMVLLMVVLALYMFGLFTFGIPASVSGTGKQNGGFAGSVGMGFLAAVLSTPCSFAILTFVLAWAQTQPITFATITILLIGLGMALPYVILTSIPKLLEKIPKPGRWMELFKHATGFILLAIGVKLLEAIPPERIINILYYAVILAVCVWMWGVWVEYNTPRAKKWLIRLAAIALAVISGFIFLAEPKKELINWQNYDEKIISAAQQEQKPILIKFTADWCFSCKILDKTVYSKRDIADLIKQKGVFAIKADTTQFDYPATAALKEIYNEPAVPVTVLLLPGKDTPVKLRGNLIGGKLREYLQTLPDKN
ncbi:MAG: cytochrome c biogenesis protein CcdA [Phycisphaerae bacterium]